VVDVVKNALSPVPPLLLASLEPALLPLAKLVSLFKTVLVLRSTSTAMVSSRLNILEFRIELIAFLSLVNNCGQLGKVCQFLPAGASGVCTKGQCQLTGCPSGFALTSGKSLYPMREISKDQFR